MILLYYNSVWASLLIQFSCALAITSFSARLLCCATTSKLYEEEIGCINVHNTFTRCPQVVPLVSLYIHAVLLTLTIVPQN